MKKMFAIGKYILSLVIAFAIFTTSLFTGVSLIVSASSTPICAGSVSELTSTTEYELSLLDNTQPNSKNNPYIIANANQMYSLMQSKCTYGGEAINTAGAYFKVADGIKAFYMNGGETVANMTTVTEIKNYFEVTNTSPTKVKGDDTNPFRGYFDGNGVTVYGIYNNNSKFGGLFPYVSGEVTIKNVSVKNSYLNSTYSAAGLVGSCNISTFTPISITVENCEVSNNYIASGYSQAGAAGLFAYLYCSTGTPVVTAQNCIVYGNELVSTRETPKECFAIAGSLNKSGCKFTNCIFLDAFPFRADQSNMRKSATYENVYTDADLSTVTTEYSVEFPEGTIMSIGDTDPTGVNGKAAMPLLDWDSVWFANTGYPVLRAFHNIETIEDGIEGCACGIVNKLKLPVCAGSVSELTNTTEYELSLLDDTQPNSQSNPYIIANANQMYSLMQSKCTYGGEAINTAGAYFKVADGIKAFYMNGGETVANMTTVAEVKNYFEVTNTSPTKVKGDNTKPFQGCFDGNGVTVYGIYNNVSKVAGLFPYATGTVTIKNVAVKNSYLKSTGGFAGGLVGSCYMTVFTPVSFTVENCEVSNNYISSSHSSAGAGGLLGYVSYNNPVVTVQNCIVYGNELESTSETPKACYAIASSLNSKNCKFTNCIFLDEFPINLGGANIKKAEVYENVYTDADLSTVDVEYTSGTLMSIGDATPTGAEGKAIMPLLDWDNIWFANTDYPVLRAFHDITTLDGDIEGCDCGIIGVGNIPKAPSFSSVIMNVGSDETQRNLTWYTDDSRSSDVQFAPASKMVSGNFPVEYETVTALTTNSSNKANYYINKATLTNLKENTEYVYRLVINEYYSNLYYFTVGSFDDYDFVFVGDPQIITSANATQWGDTLQIIDENFDAEFIVSAGDQIATPDSEKQYDWFINDKLASNAIATTIGPEHDAKNSQSQGIAYAEHYNLPNESTEYGVTVAGGDYWYIYDNTLFMNINFDAKTTENLEQHEEFIRQTISANPDTTWQVIIIHAPFFATSSHADDSATIQFRTALAPVFAELGIDVVLSGHEHMYTRSKLMLDSTMISDDVVTDDYAISPEGVQYICASSSTGSKFYEKAYYENDDYITAENYEKRKSAIHFEVTDTSFAMTSYFLDDMSVFDSFTIYNTENAVHTASDNYYISETTHANICLDCGKTYNSANHTDSNSDSICDICGWPCGEHIFEGASITLTESIAVNYMIKKSVVETLGYNDLYINFTFCGKNYTVDEYTSNDDYYIFTFDKIAPHLMTDTLYATLHGTKDDTSYTSKTYEYSIKRYCNNILESSTDEDTELRALLVDLLNYGAEAQTYTNHNTNNLANSDLTDTQKTWGTSGDVTTESVQNLKYKVIDNPTVKWKGAGLYLDEEATLRFTIQTEKTENLVVKVTCGTTTISIPSSNFVKRNDASYDNTYYIYVRGINVTQMREAVYLTVLSGETEVSNTICYSVESYANAKISSDDTALSNLLACMIKYGDAAKAYANVQ